MEIFKLFGSILIDDKEANKSMAKSEKNAEGFAQKLGGGIKTAAKWGVAVGAAATAVGGAMIAAGLRVGDMADRLLDLNAITGMSTDEIQRWERVTKEAGVSADAVTNASQRLTRQLDAMSSESNKGNQAMRQLGLSFDEISKMNADERMNVLTRALSEVDDATERAKLGTDLFGGSWKEIAPVVDLGADAMDRAKASANIFSEEDLKRANDFRVRIALLKDQANFLFMEFAMRLLPILELFFDWVDENMPQIQEFFKVAFDVIFFVIEQVWKVMSENVLPIFVRFYDWIKPYMPQIQRIVEMAFSAIAVAINMVVAPLEFVISLFQRALAAARAFFDAVGSGPIIDDMTGQEVDGFRSNGGAVAAGRSYVVGERGAEVFTPSGSGFINPDAPGGGINQTVNIYSPTPLSPSGIAREMKKINRQLAIEVGI